MESWQGNSVSLHMLHSAGVTFPCLKGGIKGGTTTSPKRIEPSLTSDNKISLNSLHQGQGVYLHRATFPLFNISAIWVSLQLTLELMCVEELQRLRAPGEINENHVFKNVYHTV